MIDDAFEPYSPRRRTAPAEVRTDDVEEAAVALALPEPTIDAGSPDTTAAGAAPLPLAESLWSSDAIAPIVIADDEDRIRSAAIELAAVACARALRYAVDRNPRLLARFVDDALRSAGAPDSAVVRVAPGVASAISNACAHEIVDDHSLSPGDVFIDSAAGTLGATVDERAALLVRSLAA